MLILAHKEDNQNNVKQGLILGWDGDEQNNSHKNWGAEKLNKLIPVLCPRLLRQHVQIGNLETAISGFIESGYTLIYKNFN